MSPRRRNDVRRALQRKGFRESNSDHLKLVYYSICGQKTSVFTKISYGSSHKDISDDNLARMAKQCRLSRAEFDDLLDCPLSREEFERKLKAAGQISQDA